MTKFFTKLLDLVFPPRCILCDNILEIRQKYVCKECDLEEYLITSNTCKNCGRPIVLIEDYCSECRGIKHYFDKGFALFRYDSIIHSTMYRLKYGNRKDVGVNLARLIIEFLNKDIKKLDVDVIIPVPLHKERYRVRGYNQANVIAKYLSEELNIPIDNKLLIRTKNTKPQSSLGSESRKNNLSGAFSLSRNNSYKTVLIVDDIYTTGSTINNCAKLLKEKGTKKVYFLVAAIASK